MQKISISLFAAIALLVGLTSAFKTSSKRTRTCYFVLKTAFQVAPATFASSYASTYKDQTSPYKNLAPVSDDDIALSGDCPSGDAKLCAVCYNDWANGDNTSELDQTGVSDFPSTAPSGSPAIILRSN